VAKLYRTDQPPSTGIDIATIPFTCTPDGPPIEAARHWTSRTAPTSHMSTASTDCLNSSTLATLPPMANTGGSKAVLSSVTASPGRSAAIPGKTRKMPRRRTRIVHQLYVLYDDNASITVRISCQARNHVRYMRVWATASVPTLGFDLGGRRKMLVEMGAYHVVYFREYFMRSILVTGCKGCLVERDWSG
jgi:hypothetical protein